MALTIPQHVAAPAHPRQSSFTIDLFYDRIIAAVNAKFDGTTSTVIYDQYAQKLIAERTATIALLKDNFDKVVKTATDDGYNLLGSATGLNLSDDSIISALNIDETVQNLTAWIDSHFAGTITALNTHMANIEAQIPDILADKIKDIDDGFNNVLKDYCIDSTTITPLSPLGIKIDKFKKEIANEFATYVGTPYDAYFFEKSSFDVSARIAAELAKKEFTDAIAPTVQEMMKAELLALTIRGTSTARTFMEDVYEANVNGQFLTVNGADTRYLDGLEALVNKYTHSGKIQIDLPEITLQNVADDHIEIKISLNVKIGTSSFSEASDVITLSKINYDIENMNNEAKKFLEDNLSILFSQIKDTSGWNDGDSLTEQDIKDNLINDPGSPNWNDFFTNINTWLSSSAGTNAQVKYFYSNNGIHVKFIDNSIQASAFEYGDKTPLNDAEKLKYWFNRHETVEETTELQNLNSHQIFTPSHIFNLVIPIKFVSRLEEFTTMFKVATDPDSHNSIPYTDLLKGNGVSLKDITKAELLKIFPNIQTDFYDEFEKETSYSIAYKLIDVSDDLHGEATLEITLTSPKEMKKFEIKIKTYNDNRVIPETINALNSYENTWEDKTPSVQPNNIPAFMPGSTPTKVDLNSIFDGIDKLLDVKLHLTSPAREEQLLKILQITSDVKTSTLTSEMVLSWNKELLNILGSTATDLEGKVDGIIASTSLLGLSSDSKYYYANIEMSQPSVKTFKIIATHFLSHEQRVVEYGLINAGMDLFVNTYLEKIFQEHEVPQTIRDQVISEFQTKSAPILADIETILQPLNPFAEVPDYLIHNVNDLIKSIKSELDSIKDDYNLNPDDLKKLKTASKVFKYVLTSVGGIIGLSAVMALMIPIRTALGDRKLRKENPKVKRSSKKMIIVSAISGLLAAGSSVAIMIYVFLTQGGL